MAVSLPVSLTGVPSRLWCADGDLIHRGMMTPAVERATLQCSMGVQPPDPDPARWWQLNSPPAAQQKLCGVRHAASGWFGVVAL
jgi:hypothetical protein